MTVDIPAAPVPRPPPEVTDFIQELQKGSSFVRSVRVVGSKPKVERATLKLEEARKRLTKAEVARMIDNEALATRAIEWAEQCGIVFIDEIDKICSKKGSYSGPDASAEGVQRDLLPLIEGCVTSTKYGNVKSDYVLFVGAGAFRSVKPSDLVAELRGRLPVRVELDGLEEGELKRILTEPTYNMLVQNREMLATEEVHLEVEESAVSAIARIAAELNRNVENIGARRLHTVLEKVLEDVNYNAASYRSQTVRITEKEVEDALRDVLQNQDLKRYVL